jgi:dephospho-CoA kinase
MNQIERPRMKLGITGGIGSGKTSVCRVFSVLGIPVFFADNEAREIMNEDIPIRTKINEIAGRDLYSGGSLNRSELAAIIFRDPTILHRVNELVHPAVFGKFSRWAEHQVKPYVIMEAAILFESGAAELVDRVATVYAPVEERIARVMLRNKLSREEITDRMKNQMDDEEKIRLSDYVIDNSEKKMIIPAILEIHKDILNHINS